MTTPKIKLVQGDTGPDIDFTLTDEETGAVIPVDDPGDVVRMYFRKVGATTLTATITLTKPNGGADGNVRIVWPVGVLADAGEYEGENEITFESGKVQTVYDKLRFTVRAQVG